jgi:hypothetical protein
MRLTQRRLIICVCWFLFPTGSRGQTPERMREVAVSPRRIFGFAGILQPGMLVDMWIPHGETFRGLQVVSSRSTGAMTAAGDPVQTTILLIPADLARAVEKAPAVDLAVADNQPRSARHVEDTQGTSGAPETDRNPFPSKDSSASARLLVGAAWVSIVILTAVAIEGVLRRRRRNQSQVTAR